jgi:serine/threonine protein kinase
MVATTHENLIRRHGAGCEAVTNAARRDPGADLRVDADAGCRHARLMPRSTLPIPTLPAPKAPPAWFRLMRWFGAARGIGPEAGARGGPWPKPGAPQPRLPRASDYALQQVIARNDRTTIYRATEHATGRLVALKTVRIGHASGAEQGLRRERFLREAAAAARLEHDHIVRVHAGGVQGEGEAVTGWLAMEWVHGTDLSRYASPARLLPEGVVLGIAQHVALALDFAHRAGVVHRDVKPSNVLFDPATGTVKVTDFGSARVADTAATRSGLIIGTPAYMAPEQLAGGDATPQCDLYSLGVMLFELLIGRRPFEADSMGDLLAGIAHQTAPRVRTLRPELPALLDDVVARLLAKTPGMRQPNGREVALELRLARAHCQSARPGSAAAAWADTSPGEDPGFTPLNGKTESTAFQGTIGS